MRTVRLQDEQWTKIRDLLRADPNAYVGNEAECRRFVEAILWISRRGAPWRLLPGEYGRWNTVYKRFTRWCDSGVCERMLAYFATDPEPENGLIDSTIVRPHLCAAGATKATKNGGQAEQALGWSRGGFSTKVHLTTDGLGYPLQIRLIAGQRHDILQAHALIVDLAFETVVADRSYNAADFRDEIIAAGAEPVIPPNRNAKAPHDCDAWRYRERHLIECFIGKIKHFRRVFSRFDKLARHYLGFLQFVSALIWLC